MITKIFLDLILSSVKLIFFFVAMKISLIFSLEFFWMLVEFADSMRQGKVIQSDKNNCSVPNQKGQQFGTWFHLCPVIVPRGLSLLWPQLVSCCTSWNKFQILGWCIWDVTTIFIALRGGPWPIPLSCVCISFIAVSLRVLKMSNKWKILINVF